MNRVLRRPMFRTGGSAEGITSGLSRQGYATNENNLVKKDDFWKKSIGDVFGGDITFGDVRDISKAVSYKPRGTNVYDFMTEFGLDLATRPASGSIFQQAAASAKEPYQRYMAGKKEAAEQEYGSESDMFKTMLSGAFDVAAAEKESGEGARLLDKENTAIMIEDFIRNIDKNEKLLQDPTLSKDKRAELELQVRIDRTNLRNVKKKNIYAEAILKSDNYVKGFVNTIMQAMVNEKNPDGTRKYPKGEEDPELYPDAFAKFMSYFEEQMATGGRVGYANAGAVMPNAMPTAMQAAGPTDQGTEVPEELQNIDYDTLRARLPSTITDDIVRLIANSAEAMEDFAMIQTQQDINNFNNKYSVELVLPAEA
jgi:hypothetical protein